MTGKNEGRIHLVESTNPDTFSPFYRVGDMIPVSGIYRAIHGLHRVAHDLTLLAGQRFPRCNQCTNEVHFELLAEAPETIEDRDFRIRLYEIPHPDAEADRQRIA